MSVRYAIYFAPHGSTPLWRFGSAVIGRDAETGLDHAAPLPLLEVFPNWRDLTIEPRRYGFHATLKAPFQLVPEAREPDLDEAIADLTRRQRPFSLGSCEVRALDRFVAVVPSITTNSLNHLAAAIVRGLDQLRAPLTDLERTRREQNMLSDRQRVYLDHWGYTYVLEEFRFHMTLTGPLEVAERAAAEQLLATLYAQNAQPVAIDFIALFKQSASGQPFGLLKRYSLGT